MRRLTIISLAGLLLALQPGCADKAPPAERQMSVGPAGKLQSMVRYTQELQTVYNKGVEISTEMDAAEALIDRYIDGELPEPDMQRQVAEARDRARGAIGEFERLLEALPPRPRFGDPAHDSGLQAYEEMVRGLTEILEAQQRLLGRLVATAVSGDETAYENASADSLALTGVLIDAETTAVEVALLGSKQGNPQRGLYHSWIGSNLAARAVLMLAEDSLRGRKLRITEARDAIENGLERAENGIASGRRDTGAMLARYEDRAGATEADRVAGRFIRELMQTFDRSYNDEARIVAVMRDFLEALVAALEAPETQAPMQLTAATETFQVKIDALVDARLREQATRLRLIDEFTAAMAELQ